MSLENIELPLFIIADLFKKSLVDFEINEAKSKHTANSSIKFLGGNGEKISLIVKNKEAIFLSDEQLKFLSGILDACKLNIGDIALINIEKNPVTYPHLTENLKPNIIILFGIDPAEMELPFNIPEFQKQNFNNQVYLFVPALDILKNDKDLKKRLWTCLQQIFTIK